MTKKLLLTFAAALSAVSLMAQAPQFVDPGTRDGYAGGVKGKVVDRNGRAPIENAQVVLMQGAEQIETVQS